MDKKIRLMQMVGQFLGIILLVSLVGYIIVVNLSPFGMTVTYSLTNTKNALSPLGPQDRVKTQKQNGQTVFVQTHDLVYFLTPMPFHFDNATVRLTFQNPDPEQTITLGFQDQEDWHYDTQFFDVPFLNTLTWKRIGINPTLYEREPRYNSVNTFLLHPPADSLIGTYAYDTDLGSSTVYTKIPDYTPATQEAVLSTVLRGRHVLYAYLENEPFRMTISKKDLNWYEDPDPMTVSVYKDHRLLYTSQIPDDGITDASKKVMPVQTITIKNPSNKPAENGVYKVILDANSDTAITQIKTNLHKIVVQGSLFPIANASVYPALISSTAATTVYTNALILSGTTYHTGGLQDITVGDDTLHINSLRSEAMLAPKDTLSKVTIPKNDVILKAFQGFFANTPDEFFIPIPYHVLPITQKDDIAVTDYILADYLPSNQSDDARVGEYTYNLSSAFIKNGKLSWIVKAPGLQDNNRQIIIKNIEVTFHKNGWM